MACDVRLCIPIEPAAKPRPRSRRLPDGRIVAYTPPRAVAWAYAAALHANQQLTGHVLEGPLRLDVVIILPRPQRLMRRRDPDGLVWCPSKPDRDNVDKALLDALASAWRDDAQICDGRVCKFYAEKTGRPRLVLRLTDELEHPDDAYRAVTGRDPEQPQPTPGPQLTSLDLFQADEGKEAPRCPRGNG